MSNDEQSRLLEQLKTCRHVFAHPIDDPASRLLNGTSLLRTLPRCTPIPAISFGGLQPDCMHIFDNNKEHVHSPMGTYNSGLVAACLLDNIPVHRVVGLFNTYVFACLGYFEQYQQNRRLLIRLGAESGYDLGPLFDEWQASGAFMFTSNHPKIRVLYGLAGAALAKADIALRASPSPVEALKDPLEPWPQWPVYPSLARALGLPEAEPIFVARADAQGNQRRMDLQTFVQESYPRYQQREGGLPSNPRLDGRWQALLDLNVR